METRRMITITIPVGGRPTKYTDAIGEQLRLQRLTGMKIHEMSEYWEVSEPTISRWLRKANCVKSGNYGKVNTDK